jgi:NAD(P)-dependent dehydrogenase (short-subunit alcohol dehydrogenase family)
VGLLDGRVAIVTGSGRGIGREFALAMAEAGAAVVVNDVGVSLDGGGTGEDPAAQVCAEIEARGGKAVPNHDSVTDFDGSSRIVATAVDTFGRLDILVNNAGTYGPMGSIETVDWDAWVKAIGINLIGNAYCARKAAAIFKAQRSGKIIFLSGGGATNPLPGISAYAASKAAIVRFMETLALELREWRIDVNAIAPGALMTRLTDELLAAGPTRVSPALFERMTKLKKEGGTSLDIPADLCVYLASAASDGLTGRLISAPWDPWPFAPGALADIGETDIYTLRRITPKERGKTWGDRE